MKRISFFLLIVAFTGTANISYSQEVKRLTLEEVINLSEDQSLQGILAKHMFRASYWQFRTFKAEYLPSLTLTGTFPDYNRIYEKIYDSNTGQDRYVEKNTNNILGELSLTQNIGFTGGSISLQSDLRRFDVLGEDGSNQYISTPISINYNQPLFRFNDLKWQKQIEPLKYEEAKKSYLANIEEVHLSAVRRFFQLALAQINMEIANMNYANADTLYRLAQGRYQLGTIAENDMLQMELSFLNAETARNQARYNLNDMKQRLSSFLGYTENVEIELIIPDEIPTFTVNADEVLNLALENNPDMVSYQVQLLEASRSVAQAKAERGLNANMNIRYGLQGQDVLIPGAYQTLDDQQRVSIGFTIPILDWGLRKGRYKMAQSSQEVTRTQVQQSMIDFEQQLFLDVAQFNLQEDQVRIAAKSDTVAMKMFEVTKQRFLIGNVDVLELNNADTKKDENKRGYIQALQEYWTFYYNLRSLTLYNFEAGKPIEYDFDELIAE
ncbi:MAG: TolC family protein [Bacteroidales bacterium]|jgi:outer membrane protein TolC|nr:TolC family protein [Bacteroidales bacterium]